MAKNQIMTTLRRNKKTTAHEIAVTTLYASRITKSRLINDRYIDIIEIVKQQQQINGLRG